MCNVLHKITQTLKSLSYPFLERKSEISSVRGINMQKRNVLRLCRLRVLHCRGWLLSVAAVSLCSARGKKYRFSLATPMNTATAVYNLQQVPQFKVFRMGVRGKALFSKRVSPDPTAQKSRKFARLYWAMVFAIFLLRRCRNAIT